MLGREEFTSRYLVQRQGTWLAGSKNQFLTFKPDAVELCSATEKEDGKESFKLADIVKVVPSRRSFDLMKNI